MSSSGRLDQSWTSRIALLCHAFGGTRAPELLDGLTDVPRLGARQTLILLLALESDVRRAHIAVAFQEQIGAEAAFRRLLRNAKGSLREALIHAAPPRWRAALPNGTGSQESKLGKKGVVRFAERLIRETSS